jgi:hypothetical protein
MHKLRTTITGSNTHSVVLRESRFDANTYAHTHTHTHTLIHTHTHTHTHKHTAAKCLES